MAGSQTGDEHGVLGFSAGQLHQARGRRAPAGVMYLFFTATTTHSATPTPTHTRPVHALQLSNVDIPRLSRRSGWLETCTANGEYSYFLQLISLATYVLRPCRPLNSGPWGRMAPI